MKRIAALLTLSFLITIPLFPGTESYVVLRRLSLVAFDVSAQMHNVHGEGKDLSGTITGDPADITTAKISLKLDPKSFDTDNDKRDKDMREKSLEVEKYPFIEFESTSIQADQKELKPAQPLKATVKGKLKLHGFEKDITVPVQILLEGDILNAEGEMHIILDEYRIFRPKAVFFQLQNDVNIKFKIGARRSQ